MRRLAILTVVACLVPTVASADFLYSYTGPSFFGGETDPGFATGVYNLTDYLTGTVLVSDAAMPTQGCGEFGCGVDVLGPDAVLHYSFTAGNGDPITDANSSITSLSFAYYNGFVAGAPPLDWHIELAGPDPRPLHGLDLRQRRAHLARRRDIQTGDLHGGTFRK